MLFAPECKVSVHRAANQGGYDLSSTFWVITTGPSCVMKGRRVCHESIWSREGVQWERGIKNKKKTKSGNRMYEIGVQVRQSLQRKNGKRQKDREIQRLVQNIHSLSKPSNGCCNFSIQGGSSPKKLHYLITYTLLSILQNQVAIMGYTYCILMSPIKPKVH